jgi:hypothetical protein
LGAGKVGSQTFERSSSPSKDAGGMAGLAREAISGSDV